MSVQFPTSDSGLEVDISQWPVLIITLPPRTSDEELKSFNTSIGKFLEEKGERYALIMDARAAETLDVVQRRMHSDFMKKRKKFAEKFCAATALVFESMVQRGVLIAILWAFKPSYPIKVFKSPDEAVDWAKKQL